MYVLQRTFAAGELAPNTWLRKDLEGLYSAGLSQMTNVMADPHGPAIARSGFEYITDIKSETYCRLFDFDVSFGESYTIAITPNFIYVLDKNGFHYSLSDVTNGNFTNGSTGWDSDNVDFTQGLAILEPKNNQRAYVEQLVSLTPVQGTSFRVVVNGFGPDGNTLFEISIGTSQGANDILSASPTGLRYDAFFDSGGATQVWLLIEVAGGGDDKALDSVLINEVLEEGEFTQFNSPYTQRDIEELQMDKLPGNKAMYLVTRGVPPHALTFEATHLWTFEPIDFAFGDDGEEPPVDLPPLWGTEYPGCITFHDGRLFLGGTYSEPVTIWGSVVHDYLNFEEGDVDSDALKLPLDKHGSLHWLRSNTKLFAGLDTGEHILFGSNGPLSVDDAQTEQQSTYGSARIHAFVIDERIAYTDTAGEIVRLLNYSDSYNSYTSVNISFQAEHITKDRIIETKFGISPRGVIYCVTKSGDIVIVNVENDQGTLGWSKHTTQGKVISLSVSKEFGVDTPWIAVFRDDVLFIERLDMANNNFTDSYRKVEVVTPTTVFTGYDHLVGKVVQIIADGKVHPDRVVAGDGSITLEYLANNVSAGLGYLPVIETLPVQNENEQGSTISHSKRYTEIFVWLLNSPRPIINGHDPYKRFSPTPMGTRETNETGLLKISVDAGWSTDSIIRIEQPLPLPMIISGVGGKLKENKV